MWREMRDEHPEEWADAVELDRLLRTDVVRTHLEFDAAPYLHRSRLPLDDAPTDRTRSATRTAWGLREAIRDAERDQHDPPGCSPFACRSDGR